MGIQPSELIDLTPYEFNLMREGYHKNIQTLREIGKFQAWITYACHSAANGQDPIPIENWYTDNPVSSEKLPSASEVDAQYKAEQEAKMNQI